MNLSEAKEGTEYVVKGISTDDAELNAFLFSLGCYSGEPITVIAHRKGCLLYTSRKLLITAPLPAFVRAFWQMPVQINILLSGKSL